MEDMIYNKHYIKAVNGLVVDGFSDAFKQPQDGDICINEQGGYQFSIDGIENPPLYENGVPLYKYSRGKLKHRTEKEIAEDRASLQIETAKKRHIDFLKRKLSETDYKIIKTVEYQLSGLESPYDIAELHAERQAMRDEIGEFGG